MKNSLSDFIAEINRNRKSGLLSVTIKGANKLLKLFFREGEIYYISCGDAKGWSCVAQAMGHELADYFFMPDVAFNHQDSTLPSLQEIIQYFKPGTTAGDPGAAPMAAAVNAPSNGQIFSSAIVLDNLKLALTRQIGPAGGKVVKRIIEQQWRPSSTPTKEEYIQLIDLLKNEVENPEDRNLFIKEAREILS